MVSNLAVCTAGWTWAGVTLELLRTVWTMAVADRGGGGWEGARECATEHGEEGRGDLGT